MVGAIQRYGLSTVGAAAGIIKNANLQALTGNLIFTGTNPPSRYQDGWAASIRGTDRMVNTRRSNATTTAVYSLNVSLESALNIVDSTSQDTELRLIVTNLGEGSHGPLGRSSRKNEWVSNIVDMNIMPINVHALMRGIPFAPIYNYVYTFEQMACLMFGENCSAVRELTLSPIPPPVAPGANVNAAAPIIGTRPDDPNVFKRVTNTREMFLKLLIDPYMYVPAQYYGYPTSAFSGTGANGLVLRIFRGDDSLLMGRP